MSEPSLNPAPRRKAIALMSGGLDSTLAAKLVQDQGVEVIGLHLSSPFACRSDVEANAKNVGIPLRIREKGEAYLDLIRNPRYGYGKNVNPCIDCRIFMFQLAEVVRRDEGADFIVTGEVLGQRPMSQRKEAIHIIDRDSEMNGLIVRPLSAHSMAPSIPEEKGWLDRKQLLNIVGRGRTEQLALAERLGIEDFEAPGGGCLLTESSFSERLRDFFEHIDDKEGGDARMKRSALVRYGRYLRLPSGVRVLVGRDKSDNDVLESGWEGAEGVFFKPSNFLGPAAVAFGELEEEDRALIGQIIARYSNKSNSVKSPEIGFRSRDLEGNVVISSAIEPTQVEAMLL